MEVPVQKIALLLADDSVTIRKVVELTLPHDRFAVSSHGDGESALEAARLNKPDALLADVVMPKMDGYQLCAAFREDPELKDVPVILMVGTFEKYDEEQGRKAGADDYIIKPFEAQSLVGKIESAIRNRAASVMAAPLPLSEEESAEIAELAGITEGPQIDAASVVETAPEIPVNAAMETEVTGGDENFPWEEEIALPDEVAEAATSPVATAEAISEPASAEAENVFSMSEFNEAAFTEALSSVLAAPLAAEQEQAAPIEEEAPEEAAPISMEAATESVIEAPEISAATAEPFAAPPVEPLAQEFIAASPVPEEPVSEQSRQMPSALSPELENAISACVKQSVQEAFATLFRDAVEKAASHVIPGLVAKAVREELEKQCG